MKIKRKSVSPVRKVVDMLLIFSLLIMLFQLSIQIDSTFHTKLNKIDNQTIVKDEIEVQTPLSLENIQFDETVLKTDHFELFYVSAFKQTAICWNSNTQLNSVKLDILIPPPRIFTVHL